MTWNLSGQKRQKGRKGTFFGPVFVPGRAFNLLCKSHVWLNRDQAMVKFNQWFIYKLQLHSSELFKSSKYVQLTRVKNYNIQFLFTIYKKRENYLQKYPFHALDFSLFSIRKL